MKQSKSEEKMLNASDEMKQNIILDQKHFRTILDNIPVCVYVKDKEYRKILVNAFELKEFGWKNEDEVIGKTDAELFDDEVGNNTLLEDQKVLIDGQSILNEEKQLMNGEWAMISKLPLKNDDDEIVGLVGLSVNVTERVKTENKLRTSYDRLNELSAQSRSFAWEIDEKGLFTFMSPNVEIVLGYSADELIQKKFFFDILAVESRNEIMKDAFDIMSKREVISNYEKNALRADGTEIWLSTNCRPLNDSNGQYIGYRGSDTDISKQKSLLESLDQARKNAEKSAKAKELFLTNMSHEIRTPLNVIIGMIREIGKEHLSETQISYLKHSEASAYQLLSIINNVLDMSKINVGEFSLDIKDFSMSAVLSNVKSILTSSATGKQIHFTINAIGNIKRALKGDALRLSQVLINLLGNSIKFTNVGTVKLIVTLIEDTLHFQRLRFDISDTGIGMSDEFQQNMFTKFTQENDHSNRIYEGTGLGLSISKEIIELMAGRININSNKGVGTEISFELKFPLGNEDSLIQVDKSRLKSNISGLNVLIVEDNEMNRFIASQSLKRAGCIIDEAENGLIAVEKVKNKQFDMILMDIQMPFLDGVETTRIIRNELEINTPIIALTANAFKHDIDLYLSSGMNDILIKPYKEEELFSKIELTMKNIIPRKTQSLLLINDLMNNNDIPFCLNQLNLIGKGDQKFLQSMLIIFRNLALNSIEQLSDAYAKNDVNQIKRIAHKLKPSLDNLEVQILYDDIRILEKYDITNENPIQLKILVEHVISILRKIVIILEPLE